MIREQPAGPSNLDVLIVHGRYRSAAPSGENNVVDQEAAALAAAGHTVDLFERHSDDIAGWPLRRKAAVPARSLWNREVRDDLARRLARSRPDLVHVHNTFPLISPSVLDACSGADVPVVATIHNYKLLCASGDFFREGKLCHECAGGHVTPAVLHGCYRGSRLATLPVVAGTALNRSRWRSKVSAYIFLSAAQRDLLRGLALPEERVFLKHNFVREIPEAPRDPEHLVAYLGRMDPAKGVPFLMRSWDAFRSQNPRSPLRLVLAGGGPLEDEVRRWAATDRSVEVLGVLPPSETAQLLRRALAAVVPSEWEESFGLVAIEAMAAGVAPLAPARGSFPELITDGVNGTLFGPGDPLALARVLEHVDREPELYVGYGRQGRTTYQKRFHPTAILEELLAIYRFAISNPAGMPHGSA